MTDPRDAKSVPGDTLPTNADGTAGMESGGYQAGAPEIDDQAAPPIQETADDISSGG